MEELLLLIVQVIVEVFAESLTGGLLDALSWFWEASYEKPTLRWLRYPLMVFLGGLIGGLTVWLFPRTLLPFGWLRIANLIVAPVISGLCSRQIARWRQAKGYAIDPDAHGLLAASACLGIVAVRFALCGR